MTAAAVLVAAAPAAAQTPRDETEPNRGAASEEGGARSGAWRHYPSERHILVRAGANVGARLSDPFAQGALAPITPYVEGTYAFVHLGSFLLGPTLNFQTGIDKTGAQFAIQPAATLYRRFNNLLGFTARVGVPLLVTRGACETDWLPTTNRLGGGVLPNRNRIPVPGSGYCPALSVGVEAGVSGALYIRSGLAITLEASFNVYFGDGGLIYPVGGGGLGILVDYEVLP